MNLQKRIFRLNMFMLVLSLLAILGVSIYVANNIYLNQVNWQSTTQQTANSQASLEQFSGSDFSTLANQLTSSGALLHVVENSQVVYSNLQDDAEDLAGISVSETAHISYVDGEIVISRLLSSQGRSYKLYVLLEDDDERNNFLEFQTFLIQLVVVGGVGIILVVALNIYFTRRILKVIIRPLEELHSGVERIQKGNYQVPIVYHGDKEFEELTQGFNQMQTSLLESNKRNRQYEQNRTQMVADISHDLRTPLTSIKGYAKGILDGIANTDEKRRQYLSVIYQKSELMERLLEKLFVFSQLETDKMPLELTKIDLTQFLKQYMSEKSLELEEEGVQFQCQLEDNLMVEVDPVQFRRILDNLVDNARKYAGVQPLILQVTAATQGETVIWTFADNGLGVTVDKLSSLFEEFYRVDESRQKIEGHGLGLSIVQNIIHRLGGSVVVDNRPGLRFTFTLPRKDKR